MPAVRADGPEVRIGSLVTAAISCSPRPVGCAKIPFSILRNPLSAERRKQALPHLVEAVHARACWAKCAVSVWNASPYAAPCRGINLREGGHDVPVDCRQRLAGVLPHFRITRHETSLSTGSAFGVQRSRFPCWIISSTDLVTCTCPTPLSRPKRPMFRQLEAVYEVVTSGTSASLKYSVILRAPPLASSAALISAQEPPSNTCAVTNTLSPVIFRRAAVRADSDHKSLDVEPECLADRVQIYKFVGNIARRLASNVAVLHRRLTRAFDFHGVNAPPLTVMSGPVSRSRSLRFLMGAAALKPFGKLGVFEILSTRGMRSRLRHGPTSSVFPIREQFPSSLMGKSLHWGYM